MATNGLEEFKEVMTDFRSVTALAVTGGVAAPLVALVTNIGPPWPTGIPVLTSIAELVVLIAIFHFWYKKSRKRLSQRMIIALVIVTISFLGYLILFDTFVFTVPGGKDSDVYGFVLKPEIKQLIDDKLVLNAEEALEGAEYNPKNVWQPWSVTLIRVGVLASWLVMFLSLSLFIATFVMVQRRRVVKPRAAASAT